MSINATTARTRHPASLTRPASILSRAIAALVTADALYRERQRLRDMPQDRLDDMGIPADAARALRLKDMRR